MTCRHAVHVVCCVLHVVCSVLRVVCSVLRVVCSVLLVVRQTQDIKTMLNYQTNQAIQESFLLIPRGNLK